MEKRWKVNEVNEGLKGELAKEMGILPLTAQLLINRGIVDSGAAYSFFSPDLNDLHDPMLMKGMERAVSRITEALVRKEPIAVWGDYDVDGVTSAALLKIFFREIGAPLLCRIPNRLSEGYGLNIEGIKALSGQGVKVIITVDCGIANSEEISFASSLGIDTIVTDHHQVHNGVPPAFSVINPLQEGCRFPFKELAGVGVAFNFIVALRAHLRETSFFKKEAPNLKRYLDIVAIGTVADMVPLIDENRILVSWGLKELNEGRRPGVGALVALSGLTAGKVTGENIAFQLAPRINAAGRLEDASKALGVLETEDIEAARSLARALDGGNSTRQSIEEKIFNDALAMVGDYERQKVIIAAKEGWHSGVTGIVAGRLVERFNRPAVLIAIEGAVGKGSIRGIKGCDVTEGLKGCSELLERYGGHKSAAGFTIKKIRIDEFSVAYARFMDAAITDEDLIEELRLDCAVSFEELSGRLMTELDRLQPFGRSNERPLFCATSADILQSEVVGRGHLKMLIKQNGRMQKAIAFNGAHFHPVRGRVDIAFYPYIDEWQGGRNLRLQVKDLRPSSS